MHGACAASNACKVVPSNGQSLGQKKKKTVQKWPFWPILALKWPKKDLQQVFMRAKVVVCRVHVLHQMPAKWRHPTASRWAKKKKKGCQKMGVHQVGFLLGAKYMLQIHAS
jgi:hypothetical protein